GRRYPRLARRQTDQCDEGLARRTPDGNRGPRPGVDATQWDQVMAEPITYRSLAALARAEAQCTRCPLYKNATQVVPGEGPSRARVMMVGEQPGDKEDIEGKPFVGPAGRMLDRAIAESGLDRRNIFVTN